MLIRISSSLTQAWSVMKLSASALAKLARKQDKQTSPKTFAAYKMHQTFKNLLAQSAWMLMHLLEVQIFNRGTYFQHDSYWILKGGRNP